MTLPLPDFAEAVGRELAAREHLWPRQVAAGRASREDAEADLATWRDLQVMAGSNLAQLLRDFGNDRLRALHATVTEAQQRRREAAASPGLADDVRQAREKRFGDTWTVRRHLDRIAWRRGLDLNPDATTAPVPTKAAA